MPYMTLGEALFDRGFTRTGFFPENAFEKDPAHPTIAYDAFDPTVPYVDPHDAVGLQVMAARYGKGVPTAKGSPPGAWHGRETTWQIEDELLTKYLGLATSFDLDHAWNKEDLKYVCNEDGLFAYQWLILTYDGLVASEVKPGGGTSSAKTPLDQRAEELREMMLDLGVSCQLHMQLANAIGILCGKELAWPLFKPFVIAALAAYRKIMEG